MRRHMKHFQPGESFEGLITSSDVRPFVAWFTASWCGPCKQISPFVQRLSEKSQGFDFVKVDIDDFPAIAEDCDIASVPTFIMYKDRTAVGRVIGANTSKIEEMMRKYM